MRHRGDGLRWAACAGFGVSVVAAVFSLPEARGADDGLKFADAWPGTVFDLPACVATPADGTDRVFVVQRNGKILVRKKQRSGEASPEAKTFVDLGSLFDKRAFEDGQGGLLTLAFHPQYKANGRFFVFYGTSSPNQAVVAGYKVSASDPDQADPKSAQILLSVPKVAPQHYGGGLAFGPDAKLYVGLGDTGREHDPENVAQDVRELEGKILRLDVDRGAPYAVPPDNPWAKAGKGVRGEIWAYGLRNPWRLSFDRELGTLWTGDPGQKSREEIDIVPRAGNMGWAIMEGGSPTPQRPPPDPRPTDLVGPVFDYGRDMGSCSIGGVVYRGQRCAPLKGQYVFSDFMTNKVYSLPLDASGTRATGAPNLLGEVAGCCSINEDAQGELYFCSLEDGQVLTLRPKRP